MQIDNIPLDPLIRKARHGDIDVLKKKKILGLLPDSGYRGNIPADELSKLGFDAITIRRRLFCLERIWK